MVKIADTEGNKYSLQNGYLTEVGRQSFGWFYVDLRRIPLRKGASIHGGLMNLNGVRTPDCYRWFMSHKRRSIGCRAFSFPVFAKIIAAARKARQKKARKSNA